VLDRCRGSSLHQGWSFADDEIRDEMSNPCADEIARHVTMERKGKTFRCKRLGETACASHTTHWKWFFPIA